MRLPFVVENTIDLASDVNGSLLAADGLITSFVSGILSTPPATPTAGMRVGVATGGTGAFSGKGGMLAVWESVGSFWNFFSPVLCAFDGGLYMSHGGDWKLLASVTP